MPETHEGKLKKSACLVGKQHKVLVNDLKLFGYHGTNEEERLHGTFFQFDLEVSTDFGEAMNSDSIKGTLNYVELISLIKKQNQEPSKLLEHLGGRIAKSIFNAHPLAQSLSLKIQKLNPPIREDLKSVAIQIEESR